MKFIGVLFLVLPIVIVLSALCLFFNLREVDYLIPVVFGLFSVFVVIFEWVIFRRRRSDHGCSLPQIKLRDLSESETLAILIFVLIVFAFGLVDIWIKGVAIDNPDYSYSSFSQVEARIRHISSLAWIFAPLFVLGVFKFHWGLLLFGWSLLFPVLTLDRNRLLMSLITVSVTLLLVEMRSMGAKKRMVLAAVGFLCAGLIFPLFGKLRSGNDALVGSYTTIIASEALGASYGCKLPSELPLREGFRELNPSIQWFAIYLASPIYNLSVQNQCEIRDNQALRRQLMPGRGGGGQGDLEVPSGPLLIAPYLSVGTEAMAFYLTYGLVGLLFCLSLTYILLQFVAYALSYIRHMFIFVFFLRVVYCSIFFAFAPQLYLWSTLGLFGVLVAMWIFSRLMSLLLERTSGS